MSHICNYATKGAWEMPDLVILGKKNTGGHINDVPPVTDE
jgi:hypothetical protein